jgi:hypothetical protein
MRFTCRFVFLLCFRRRLFPVDDMHSTVHGMNNVLIAEMRNWKQCYQYCNIGRQV